MKTISGISRTLFALLASTLGTAAFSQTSPSTSAPLPQGAAPGHVDLANLDQPAPERNAWYFSWGYSRQHYARSDIHVHQGALGNDFTVHQVAGSDFPANVPETFKNLRDLNFTTPQENLRIGWFSDASRTFAVEFSLDHTKYNTNLGQVAHITGTVNHVPVNQDLLLTDQSFSYALHNGLNHIMLNAVWLRHLLGPQQQTGDLQFIGRVGAGILLPHAQNTIFGQENHTGPKNRNVCCFSSNDWWQLNGWTVGTELGLRYSIYKPVYLEFTTKLAYGVLRHVPVYEGTADQTIWMSEQVLSLGTTF